ncbi:ABC transporter permease subunit [Methanocella conradii]|uniref:ABC transporter permease subunit n=1 Tax=Methanocella conradii TaxID=1175444 RepID=UPI0024B33DF1|nr:ABC transporter permease subunit [Methanocella conradii]MDI6897367.1 ABC transporter permease subunit [Methanocella conradii]
MRPELIVAEKEFRDHLASKRFLAIFAILMLLSFYGVYSGMDAYNKRLDQYKNPGLVMDQPFMKEAVESLQKEIQDAEARGDSPESIQALKDQLSLLTNPPMPSVLEVFNSMVIFFTFLGMILGAAMGFDQISKERDEGTLKFLVSSPIYRDAIINGKAIGAIATLAVALAAAFLLAIAIVMFRGVVPGLDDMLRIAAFFAAALLYCTVFFAIAMMMSAITKSTSMSVICTVGLVVLLIVFSIVALIVSGFIAQAIVGPAPPIDYGSLLNSSTGSANVSYIVSNSEYMNYTTRLVAMEFQISDAITTVSPVNDFGGLMGMGVGGIGNAILSKTPVQSFSLVATTSARQVSLLDSLASVWVKIFVLIVEMVVAFAVSYVAFMRMDVR